MQPTADDAPSRATRRDAVRNRELLLAAATEVLASEGIDAPLELIARRADVGIATLYRNFPSRDELVTAALMEPLRAHVQAARDGLGEGDPWVGLCGYLYASGEMSACHAGLNDVLGLGVPAESDLADTMRELYRLTRRLFDRAKAAGAIRADARHQDLALVMWGTSGVTRAAEGVADQAWRRHLAIVLDGLSAPARSEIAERPLSDRQVYQATSRSG